MPLETIKLYILLTTVIWTFLNTVIKHPYYKKM